jgi:coenzyme Q-binding protein COQ10
MRATISKNSALPGAQRSLTKQTRVPKYETTRRMPFTPQQMFALVADVERYPEFVPMCESLAIQSEQKTEQGSKLIATMDVGYGSLKESFTTEVDLIPDAPKIIARYLNGPFKHLENRWTFISAPDNATDVHFWIDYEFKSPILAVLMGAVFDKAFRKFTDAFENRAQLIYGTAQSVKPGV